MTFQVVTPEKVVLQEKDVDIVIIKSQDKVDQDGGEVGIMKDHAPMLVRIPTSSVRYMKGEEVSYLAVAGGFVEVRDSCVTILSTGAERVSSKEEVDVAVQARLRAEAWLERGEVGKVGFKEKLAEAEVKKEAVHLSKEHGDN